MTNVFLAYLINADERNPIDQGPCWPAIGGSREEAIAKTKALFLASHDEDEITDALIIWDATVKDEPDSGWFLHSHEV